MAEKKTRICLITAALTPGGAERVMASLANEFSKQPNVEVHLIILTGGAVFYFINKRVKTHCPGFDYKDYKRWYFTIKLFIFLRQKIKEIKPESLLSFEGRYNSFVLLASLGIQTKTFISDRSRPGISYGKLVDFINRFVYRFSNGIIAQTSTAADYIFKSTSHRNIKIIGNPIPNLFDNSISKQNIILNVGRFIESKQQGLLIEIFNDIKSDNWELWFVGDGPKFTYCKNKAQNSPKANRIKFFGNQKDVNHFYMKSAVFAFTSRSEGFPNSLAEAMSAGCACISFDCIAGPSELIAHNENGYLIDLDNSDEFKSKLEYLLMNSTLRSKMAEASVIAMKKYDITNVSTEYFHFILNGKN